MTGTGGSYLQLGCIALSSASSKMATARVHPAEAPRILCGKHATMKPFGVSTQLGSKLGSDPDNIHERPALRRAAAAPKSPSPISAMVPGVGIENKAIWVTRPSSLSFSANVKGWSFRD